MVLCKLETDNATEIDFVIAIHNSLRLGLAYAKTFGNF